jgi:serine/threonine protein kinase
MARHGATASASIDPVFGRLVEELTARLQAGEPIDWPAVEREHAEFAEELRAVRPALEVLGRLSGAGDAAVSGVAALTDGEDLVPGVLGDFRILREVGRGGMGVVYEAEQVSLRRRVALKVLPYAGALDARQLQRFRNEALAAASLHHEHIVPVYFVGCERGVHFYAMQFIDGQSLADVIRTLRSATRQDVSEATGDDRPGGDSPTPPVAALSTEPAGKRGREYYRTAARLIAAAADALEYAHSLGVVHRDVKPANLLLDGSGKLWVADFGLARVGSDAGLTMSGDLLGTLRYMSPEQALAKHGLVDHRTDVYSLGATLYELLTLRPAVAGDDKQEILHNIASAEPTPPRKLDRTIPAGLETITLKAVAKTPAERYATAREFAEDLRRFLEDKPIRARRPTVRQRLARWGRRHPGLTAALGLVAGLLIAGVWAWNRETTKAETAARSVAAEADQLWDADRLPEALAVARRAADLLPRFGGDTALRQQIVEQVANLRLLNRLEEARMEGAAVRPDGLTFDRQRTAQLFREAFSEYGVDVLSGDEETVAQALRHPAVAPQVVAALAEWETERYGRSPVESDRLSRLIDALDTDPRRLASRLVKAARERDAGALKRLAEETKPELTAPFLLNFLANELREASCLVEAERLLRAAQQHYPANFGINENLGNLLLEASSNRSADAISYCRAGVAVRPRSPGAWLNLGRALQQTGRYGEAANAYRRAISLKSDYWAAHLVVAL